ncbi:Short-chain dehydrogenase [Actinidia chinensis var. chinensis]|uniref:Short-chain dehydrogenase n=1 Tax=Actinidia chinensis var. chinensis TaxID=1590841 RepID=A0A2R6QG09_ACTCC|nr:Short-chain dehydrogenase [Actinidia chinensis var. chinensis]
MASPSRLSLSAQDKRGLSWMEWLEGWYHVIYEVFFQRITARNLKNPLPLAPLNDLTCIVIGSTSGIGFEIARQLAESGACAIMAVKIRLHPTSHNLIQKWQSHKSGTFALNIDVMELNLLSLESVVRFSQAWNSISKPLNVLINDAGIFSIGEHQKFSNDGGAPCRIINVNSIMHFISYVDTNDMNFISRKTKFSSLKMYLSSKLELVMFSSILQKNLPDGSGIRVVFVVPGSFQTNVARDIPKIVQIAYHLIPYFLFNAEEGSRSTLFAATDSDVPKYCAKLKTDVWPVCAYISYCCSKMSPSKESLRTDTSRVVCEKTVNMVGLPAYSVEMILEGKDVQCRYGAHLN